MGRLDDIQIALKPFKKSEPLKKPTQPDLARPDPTVMQFDNLLIGEY